MSLAIGTDKSGSIQYFLLLLPCVLLSIYCLKAQAFDSSTENWENDHNITQVTDITSIEANPNDDSLFIRRSLEIFRIGLENTSTFSTIWPPSSELFYDMDWSDSCSLMAFAQKPSYMGNSSLWNYPIVLFNADGQPISAFPKSNSSLVFGEITDIEWRPKTNNLAIGFFDGTVFLVDTTTQSIISQWKVDYSVIQMKWEPSGNILAIVSHDPYNKTNSIYLFELEKNNKRKIGGNWDYIDLDWSYDGLLLFISDNSGIYRFNIKTYSIEKIIESGGYYLSSSPTDPIIVISGYWNIRVYYFNENITKMYNTVRKQTQFSGWNGDGSIFYSMDEDEIVGIWTVKSSHILPKVGIEYPHDEETVKGIINITGWAQSTTPNVTVCLRIGQADWIIANGSISWSFLFNTKYQVDGPLLIRARAFDINGVSDISILRILVSNNIPIDNHPPNIFIYEPKNDTNSYGVVRIYGGANDDNLISNVQVRFKDQYWQNARIIGFGPNVTWEIYLDMTMRIAEKLLIVEARAYDGVLYSELSFVRIYISSEIEINNTIDLEVLYPLPGMVCPRDISVLGRITQGRANIIVTQIDNGNLEVANGTSIWKKDYHNLSSGYHIFNVIAVNDVQTSKKISIFFIVDISKQLRDLPPTIGIEMPLSNTIVFNELYISGWSLDDNKIILVEIKIENASWIIVNGTTQWSILMDISNQSAGWFEIKARAFDGLNYSDITTVEIYHSEKNDLIISPPNDFNIVILLILFLIFGLLIIILLTIKT
jgi:hypothetical protein